MKYTKLATIIKVLPKYFDLTLTQENNQGIGLSYVSCNVKQILYYKRSIRTPRVFSCLIVAHETLAQN